jgi:hypothetical protein
LDANSRKANGKPRQSEQDSGSRCPGLGTEFGIRVSGFRGRGLDVRGCGYEKLEGSRFSRLAANRKRHFLAGVYGLQSTVPGHPSAGRRIVEGEDRVGTTGPSFQSPPHNRKASFLSEI